MHPPNSDFALSSTGKADITASVEQSKTEFTYADGVRIGQSVKATGTVTAHDMTAGKWHGQYQFNVNLGKKAAEPTETKDVLYLQSVVSYNGFKQEGFSVQADGVDVPIIDEVTDSELFFNRLQNNQSVVAKRGGYIFLVGTDNISELAINLTRVDTNTLVTFHINLQEIDFTNDNGVTAIADDGGENTDFNLMYFESVDELFQAMGG